MAVSPLKRKPLRNPGRPLDERGFGTGQIYFSTHAKIDLSLIRKLGEQRLAAKVGRFVGEMKSPRTDRELVIEQLIERKKIGARSMQLTR